MQHSKIITMFTLRAQGSIVRVRKAPVESDEDAATRGWWMVANGAFESGKAAPAAPALTAQSFQMLAITK